MVTTPEPLNPDPYARIAAVYDVEFRPANADTLGYERRRIGERLLVLGCGTGRVCRGLAAREIVGLDRSAPMIQLAQARASASEVYVQGDMSAFSLGVFDEMIIPNGAFAFLSSRTARAACLSACRAALAGGGSLTIDVPMPEFERWGERHHPETPAWEGEVDGRHVWRTRETFRDPVAQRLELIDRYRDDSGWKATSALVLHLFSVDEMHWMLEANGFYAESVWGDHTDGPIRAGSPRLLVRALPL